MVFFPMALMTNILWFEFTAKLKVPSSPVDVPFWVPFSVIVTLDTCFLACPTTFPVTVVCAYDRKLEHTKNNSNAIRFRYILQLMLSSLLDDDLLNFNCIFLIIIVRELIISIITLPNLGLNRSSILLLLCRLPIQYFN